MRRRLVLGALLAPLAARAQGQGLVVEAPWARATPPRAEVGAAYLTIVNRGTKGDELVAATSPVARAVELHAHLHENGVMRMRPVTAVEVNPGEPAVFRPGGLHLMLVGLARPLNRGESFALTLRFRDAGELTVQVPVQAAGASGPAAAHGH